MCDGDSNTHGNSGVCDGDSNTHGNSGVSDGDSNTHGNSGVWQCVTVIAILTVIV